MEKKQEEMLLESLKEGNSIFKYIPQDIGEIVYCDTNNTEKERDPFMLSVMKVIFYIVAPLVVVALSGFLLRGTILIIIVIFAFIYMYMGIRKSVSFKGEDLFVGTEGAAVVSFKRSRNNTKVETFMLFREIEEVVSIIDKQYNVYNKKDINKNKVYQHEYQRTEYLYGFLGGENEDRKKTEICVIASSFKQEHSDGYYEDRHFRFLNKVDYYWSKYKFPQMKNAMMNGESIRFNYYRKGEDVINDYIVLRDNSIIYKGWAYEKSYIEEYSIRSGYLIFKYKEKSTLPFELTGEAEEVSIPLNGMTNYRLFVDLWTIFISDGDSAPASVLV